MPADPKTKRIVASKTEWERLRAKLCPPGTRCVCGCGRRAESLHHLVGRGQGGDDIEANLVPLAGDGTRLCHGALTSSQRAYDSRTGDYIDAGSVRAGIRRRLSSTQRAYVLRKKGLWFLDTYYPRENP